MKINLIVSVFLLFLSIQIVGQRKIKKLEVNEKGFKIEMKFETVKDKMSHNGLIIHVVPISAEELSPVFQQESFYNGKFNYSHYEKSRKSYFLKKKRGKRKKSDLEFFLDGLDYLLDNEMINKSEYDNLEKKMLYYYDEEFAKTHYSSNLIEGLNPYILNGKYLNLFKVKFCNPTNKIITFQDDFVINNGDLQLNSLSSEYITDRLDREVLNVSKKLSALERHNYSKGLSVPPNSEVEKLIAVLPINFNFPSLKLAITNNSEVMSWKIEKNEDSFDDNYSFYELPLRSKIAYDIGFTILIDDSENIFKDTNKIFIGQQNLNTNFELLTIAIGRNTLYFSRTADLKGADYIDDQKNRRKSIYFNVSKIEDVKRKVSE